jgi:hypothetical protein
MIKSELNTGWQHLYLTELTTPGNCLPVLTVETGNERDSPVYRNDLFRYLFAFDPVALTGRTKDGDRDHTA